MKRTYQSGRKLRAESSRGKKLLCVSRASALRLNRDQRLKGRAKTGFEETWEHTSSIPLTCVRREAAELRPETGHAEVKPGPRPEHRGREAVLAGPPDVPSSSLSAVSPYRPVALRAEVEGLRAEVGRRREERREARHAGHEDFFLCLDF
ncbi:hypothetical protein EYF80_026132 [Liparis tanakae]|uniref:Uncharacterized protein n=1 Tax=Liparis tanakae TaxID=230148 RepID=A0A4Z2HCV6_9TELE|nr:hypothetical protein EYF80_026132 [Liparis tanakae]